MKKKLIQILMLLVVAVSVGSFVSCKDTNEDQYNELRTQTAAALSENADLKTALQTLQSELQKQITAYITLQTQLDDLTKLYNDNKTTTDGKIDEIDGEVDNLAILVANLGQVDVKLTGLIDGLRKDLDDLQKDENATEEQVTKLANEISELSKIVYTNDGILSTLVGMSQTYGSDISALQVSLAQVIKDLQALQENVKTCNCEKYTEVLENIAVLQTEMTEAKDKISTALANAGAAQNTADIAKGLAETATQNAEAAFAYAQTAADQATQAGQNAALAQQKAQDAYDLATLAFAAANQANSLADRVLVLEGAVAANTANIATNTKAIDELKTTLQTTTKRIEDLISANKDELQASIDRVSTQLSESVATLKSDFTESINNLDGKLSESIANLGKELADNVSKIQENAANIQAITNRIDEYVSRLAKAEQDIDVINNKISAMETTLGLMPTQIQQAFDAASQAAAKAETNSTEISTLKSDIATLNALLKGLETQMNNNNSASQTEIQSLKETTQGLQNAITALQSTLSGQIGDNSVAIGKLQQAIADMEKAGAKADSTLNKLTEKVDKLVTDLAVLDAEFKAYKIQAANDLETVKADYKALIEQTKLEIQAWVENALKDYLKKEDVDLTKYVTKEEVANYISKAELDKYATLESLDGYVTQEVFDLVKAKLDGMMPKSEVEAAIQVAITNLANEMLQKFLDLQNGTIAEMLQRIATNEEAIDWLKRWHDAIEAKGGSVTTEDLNHWLDIINEKIAGIEGGTSTTIIETIKETVTTEILKEVNSQLTTTIEEVLSDQLINNLDNYNLITEDNIGGIVDNLFDITELKQQLEDLKTQFDNLPGSPDYKDRIEALESQIEDLRTATANLAQLEADVTALKNSASTYATKEELQNLKEELAEYAKTSDLLNYVRVDQIAGIIEAYGYLTSDDLDGYAKTSEVTEMLKSYYTSQEVKDYVTEQLSSYVTGTELDSKLGEYVTQTYLSEKGYITLGALEDYLENYAKKEELEALRGELDKYLSVDDFNIAKQELLDAIGTNTTSINEIKATLTTVVNDIETIKDDITDLQTRVKATEDKLVELETKYDDAIAELKTDISALQDYLAKQVTSIQIQGTKNPWFGTFSTPFGTQSNVLIALYGTPDPFAGKNYFEFPTSISDNYVRTKEALTDADIAMLKESGLTVFKRIANGEACFMYDRGYAGKIYMTINPNTADVTGLQPQIVNSKDEVSYISLDGVKPSTEKLQFGWTRADQSSNGFYEADAVVRPADVQKISAPAFNLPAIKDAAQNVRDALTDLAKSESTGSNRDRLEKIADDVNTIVKGLRFDRSGLKVSYDGGGKTNSVYSEYNLAATAFKPLSLETAKDFNYATIPGYEQVNNLLDRITNRLNDQIGTFFKDFSNNPLMTKLANFKIDSIRVPKITDDLLAKFELHMDTVFIFEGLEYHFNMPVNVPVHFAEDLVVPVSINGLEVTVPVHIDKSVAVNLDNVSITTPTIVVHGTATGHPTEVYASNDSLITELILPVFDENNNIVVGQYVTIPIQNLNMSVELEAGNDAAHGGSGAGSTINLEGQPIASVVIDTTFTTTIDYTADIPCHLEVDTTFTVNISKYIQLGYIGYEKDPSQQDGYAHDEDGNLIPLKDADGNPIPGGQRGFVLRFNYDMRQAAQDLWGMAAVALDDINGGLLANVQDLIAEINKQLQSINKYESQLTGMVTDATSKVKDFLDKINRAAVRIINSTNQRFQPFMVASTSKGMKTLSGSKGYPTYLSSDVTLYPSSQTMELFVPFARKHVAVTNVFKGNASAQKGNGECKAVLKAANTGDMNKVLDGTVQQIQMSNLQKGYVYEVAYSALDFHGKMATRKYYISVK